jgi:fluoride exporter
VVQGTWLALAADVLDTDKQIPQKMRNYVLVFLGGGLGAVARYWLSGWIPGKIESDLPLGTLAVNILGCFLIGLLMSAFEERFLTQPSLRVFLTIGILGGFTTFSTFSFETVALIRDGEALFATMNILVSIVTCIGGTAMGMYIGRLF